MCYIVQCTSQNNAQTNIELEVGRYKVSLARWGAGDSIDGVKSAGAKVSERVGGGGSR